MEDRWITAKAIIEQGLLTEINLISLVRDNIIPAYDSKNFSKIDWSAFEKQFNEIKDDLKFVFKNRIVLDRDAPETPWNMLHRILRNWVQIDRDFPDNNSFNHDRKLNLRMSQYLALDAGWNNDRILEIIQSSLFKEKEILSISHCEDIKEVLPAKVDAPPCNNNQAEANLSPQKAKNQNTLLKIIGALVEIHYQGKLAYMHGEKLSHSAVEGHILEELSKIDIDLGGIKEGTIRKKTKEAYKLFTEELAEIIPAASEQLKKRTGKQEAIEE